MPGLYVVATPIGNLADLSERALRVLKEVDGVLCEDTRRTLTLLSHFGVTQKLHRLDQHSTAQDIQNTVDLLLEGKSFALVSDAGTPAISDPGAELVRACHQNNIRVQVIPGPSAVTALLSISGLRGSYWSFRGFFPRQRSDQEQEIKMLVDAAIEKESHTVIWFESPQRIVETVKFLAEVCDNFELVVGKELTKQFEKIWTGKCSELSSHIQSECEREGERGEWVFAVQVPAKVQKNEGDTLNIPLENLIEFLLKTALKPSEIAKNVSQYFGIPRNKVYDCVQKMNKSNP